MLGVFPFHIGFEFGKWLADERLPFGRIVASMDYVSLGVGNYVDSHDTTPARFNQPKLAAGRGIVLW
jgi:hypothetical protein